MNASPIFDHTHSKITEATFGFPELVLACKKKSIYFIYSFLRYNQFWIPLTGMATTIPDYAYQENLKLSLNFYELALTWQKVRLFRQFVLEIDLIYKNCDLNGWEHFGPYIRNQIFRKYGIWARAQQII